MGGIGCGVWVSEVESSVSSGAGVLCVAGSLTIGKSRRAGVDGFGCGASAVPGGACASGREVPGGRVGSCCTVPGGFEPGVWADPRTDIATQRMHEPSI